MGKLEKLESYIRKLEKQNKALKENELRYRHLFEKSPIMIYVTDRKGTFININQAGVDMIGCESSKEVIGTKIQDYFFENEKEFGIYEEKINEKGVITHYQTILKRKDGSVLNVNLTGALRTTLTCKLKGYEGFVIDITDRVEAEKTIRMSEEKYKAILDNSLAGIYMFQSGGYFSYANKRLLSILGYDSAEEVIGRKFWEFVAPEDQEVVKKRGLEREHREIEPRHYPFRMIRKDGSTVWVDMRSSHASYMGIPAAVGNFIDITKEKKAQEEIQLLSRKLIEGIEEERKSLASDLHDEFGQALTLLQFDIETLKSLLNGAPASTHEICIKIMDQIQVLAEKIRNTTSRLRPDLLDHLGLVPTMKWFIEDFEQRFNDIQIDFQAVGLKRRLPPAVEIVIYRIFQEGMNNVNKHANASQVNLKLTASHPKVIFYMQDNGSGFIQKDSGMPKGGKSLGIGLLSMKERVAALDGSIKIKSTVGKGTAIRVELPME
jgi:PAS domain S-box-containing protein